VTRQVRKLVEMVLRYTLQDLHATAPFLAPMVKGYRGGYTKDDRREIERDLFGGGPLTVHRLTVLRDT
jgi:DEAD/DEAH box helicase domain-containing protein